MNNIIFRAILLWVFMFFSFPFYHAQTIDHKKMDSISFSKFIHLVGTYNKALASEKFNVSIAQADAISEEVFPDPELSIGAFDNGQRRNKMGYGYNAELSYQLELGGKRKARINLAKSQVELEKAMLAEYYRNLRADAAILFFETIKNKKLLDFRKKTYQAMKKMSMSDSIRYKLGDIAEINTRQTSLEAKSALNEVYQKEAEYKTSISALNLISGHKKSDTIILPEMKFIEYSPLYSLEEFLAKAKENRTDLITILKDKDVAQNMLRLSKANRAIDLGLSLGFEYNAEVTNEIAPTPQFNQWSLGVSIPLKFSNKNKGTLIAARYKIEQAEANYDKIISQIQAEVTQSFYTYSALENQIKVFSEDMIENAKKIIEGKIYSYKRGESSLLEVLEAQRSYNEVQENYIEAQYAYSCALVELQRSSGTWMDFLSP